MANTATLVASVQTRILEPSDTHFYNVVLDTADTDQVIRTPVTGYSVYLKSRNGSDNLANTLTFKQRSPHQTGTVATTSGSATITGTDTAFTTDYAVGDEVVIADGDTLTISTIDSDTQITATVNASTTVSGKTHQKQTEYTSAELASYQGYGEKVEPGAYILATKASWALVVSTSVEMTLLVAVQEGKQ